MEHRKTKGRTGTRNYQGLNITLIQNLKKKIEELKESEEKFKNIFDNASDGILLADITTKKFVVANKTICRMLGYSEDEIKKLNVTDIHPKKDLPHVMGEFKKQAQKEISLTENLPVQRKDGSIFYADINAMPVTFGGKTYLAGIFRDITERKKAQEKIEAQNEFLNNIFEAIRNPFYVIDAQNYRIIKANSAAHISKLTDEPTCYAMTHKRTRPCSFSKTDPCPLEIVKKTKKLVVVEHVHYIDGKQRIIEVHGYPILDKKGNVIQMIEQGLDVTERKKVEEALKESEAKYRTLLENLPQKIFLKDRNSVYISCNKNYARDLKIKPEQIVGKTDLAFYPKKLARKYRADDRRIMKTKKIEDIEEEYVQNGKKVFVRTIKTPVKDENGKVRGVLGTFWEIVPHKGAGKTNK